jgi:hypothetical protein
MTHQEIIDRLRDVGRTASATKVAAELGRVAPNGLTQATLIFYFFRAFRQIPLDTLLEAGAWYRVSAGGWSDEALDAFLQPWLPTELAAGELVP